MAYTLGTIEFRSQFAPQRLSEGRSVNYTKLPTIEGTPVMQRTFTNLAEFSITIFLHFDFVNVAQAILDLKAAQESSEALPLSSNAGQDFGNYVIKDLNVDYKLSAADGSPMIATLSLSLCEYIEAGSGSFSFNQVDSSVAVTVNNPLQTIQELPPTNSVQTVTSTYAAQAASIEGLARVEEAQTSAAAVQDLVQRALSAFEIARDSVTSALDTVGSLATATAQVQQYEQNLQSLSTAVNATLGTLNNGDLANSLTNARTSLAAANTAVSSANFLTLDVIARKV